MGTSKPLSMGSIGPREGGQKKNPGGGPGAVPRAVPETPLPPGRPSQSIQMCRRLDTTATDVSKVGYHRQKCVESWISPPQICRKVNIIATHVSTLGYHRHTCVDTWISPPHVSKVVYHRRKCVESWISNFRHICGCDI